MVLIDHASIDGTRELASAFLGGGLLRIVDMSWQGSFDLTGQLVAKQELYDELRHDWHMHTDADEWLRTTADTTLAEFLDHEIPPQYTVVNFSEFVFVPPNGIDMWRADYRRMATRYYFYSPRPFRLMRAWRRGKAGSIVPGAGHRREAIAADRIFPVDQVLRHYVGLSWSDAISRRANRTYSSEDLARGWHGNRMDMRTVAFPTDDFLHVASPWDTRTLDTSRPSPVHFWEPGFGQIGNRASRDDDQK